MSLFADALRPFWVRGLNEVSGRQIKEIPGWISDEDYQVYEDVLAKSFVLHVSKPSDLMRAYAAESDRIACATFETIARMASVPESKSLGWQCIQLYYAAFFAAHSLLRVFGGAFNTLGRSQTRSVLRVASVWGVAAPGSLPGGLYRFSYDADTRAFSATNVTGSPHESFWKTFDTKIGEIAGLLLTSHANFTVDVQTRQAVALKLAQVRTNLSWSGAQSAWLTQVRNSINYDHKWATWWPYSGRPKYYERIRSLSSFWRDDPLEIELNSFEDCEMLRFQATCNFLISVCRETLQDLANRCPTNNSFVKLGTLAYWNFTEILK